MKEVFEKIREKLEAEKLKHFLTIANSGDDKLDFAYEKVGDALDGAIKIVNQVEEEYNNGWIPVEERLPEHSDDLLLIQCSGKPRSNIELHDAFQLASYTEEGWILEIFPEWKGADVVAWQPLPELYKKGE